MPQELEPEEIADIRARHLAAWRNLQQLVPPGTTLLLRYERETQVSPSRDFWILAVSIADPQAIDVDLNDDLSTVLVHSLREIPDKHIRGLWWHGQDPADCCQELVQDLGKAVWNDPGAFTYRGPAHVALPVMCNFTAGSEANWLLIRSSV